MNERSYVNDVSRGAAATGSTMTGFFVGALVGAGIALLLAPAPGGETRRKLGETARRLTNAAGERLSRRSESEPDIEDVSGSGPGETNRPGRPGSSREPLAGRTPRTGTPGTPA